MNTQAGWPRDLPRKVPSDSISRRQQGLNGLLNDLASFNPRRGAQLDAHDTHLPTPRAAAFRAQDVSPTDVVGSERTCGSGVGVLQIAGEQVGRLLGVTDAGGLVDGVDVPGRDREGRDRDAFAQPLDQGGIRAAVVEDFQLIGNVVISGELGAGGGRCRDG